MRIGGRLSAAVEVLKQVLERHRPAGKALADWGRAHRFAGSGDRSAIGTLVYDALRQRYSIAARMGNDTARALALGAYANAFDAAADDVAQVADGSDHALSPLTDDERSALDRPLDEDAPVWVRGDLPEWLVPSLEETLGEQARVVKLGQALAQRAPVDLRANSLKTTRERVLKVLGRFQAQEAPLAPLGVRIPVPEAGARTPNVEAEAGHGKGWFEVQDAGSQVVAALAGAGPRLQVLDLCAGAGGKTLAMAAAMQNTGQVFCYDTDRFQLRPIFERLKRAGVRNAQVMEAGDEAGLSELDGRFDVVLADAPCSGSGTWRRRPDAKWRLTREHVDARVLEQQEILSRAALLVKPGGRLVYATCSVLREENSDQIAQFLSAHPDYEHVAFEKTWKDCMGTDAPRSACDGQNGLLLTPDRHGTDGFYIAVMTRARE